MGQSPFIRQPENAIHDNSLIGLSDFVKNLKKDVNDVLRTYYVNKYPQQESRIEQFQFLTHRTYYTDLPSFKSSILARIQRKLEAEIHSNKNTYEMDLNAQQAIVQKVNSYINNPNLILFVYVIELHSLAHERPFGLCYTFQPKPELDDYVVMLKYNENILESGNGTVTLTKDLVSELEKFFSVGNDDLQKIFFSYTDYL
jgi:hypothetical protein